MAVQNGSHGRPRTHRNVFKTLRPPAPLLPIEPPTTRLDESVLSALRKVAPAATEAERQTLQNRLVLAPRTADALRAATFDTTERILLGRSDTGSALLKSVVLDEAVPLEDPVVFVEAVKRKLVDVKAKLAREVVDDVARRRHLDIPAAVRSELAERVQRGDIPLGRARTDAAVQKAAQALIAMGDLPAAVARYAKKREIPEASFTPEVRGAMIEHLLALELPVDDGDFLKRCDAGEFDEYFAIAFDTARRLGTAGGEDPLDAARQRGAVVDWDFTVDTFEEASDAEISRENILAAGALDYVYWLGDAMGIYRVADAIVLRWAAGDLDIGTGDAGSKLYRYFKLRKDRASEDERAMLYRRVLGRGDAELLSRMVPNEQFERLWHKLMTEVATYIRKVEETKGGADQVSANAIFQAVSDLQHNLTDCATGLAHMQVSEMYAHLKEAIELLRDEEVLDHFGGGQRKSLWSVVERVVREELSQSLNVSALRTLAVQGNRVFRFIADFDRATPRAQPLTALTEPAEAWIIAQAETGDLAAAPPDEEVGEEKDAFADWES